MVNIIHDLKSFNLYFGKIFEPCRTAELSNIWTMFVCFVFYETHMEIWSKSSLYIIQKIMINFGGKTKFNL